MTHCKSIIAALAAPLIMMGPATAREAVVGLSPLQSRETVRAQAERVVQHLVKTVAPGETALIFDAWNIRLIGRFAVPGKAAYANPRAKLQANRTLLADLKRFIDSAQAVPGRAAHINLPGLLRTVGQNYPSDGDRALIVLGSPIFDDPKAPSLSMRGGRVPNDGHIATTLKHSVFGTAGLGGSLKGTDVYFGVAGADDWAISNEHAFYVERFWTLSAQGHGGSMPYFGDDWETLFRLATSKGPDRKHSNPLVPTDKLEMLQFAPDQASVSEIYRARTEETPAPEPMWRAAEGVRIGITWGCLSCDLDLYVRPKPGGPVIYYGRANTPVGRLFKDFTNSPTTGFETVALAGKVDLSKARIAINLYGGRVRSVPVTGELRIAIGNKVWAAPFAIAASKGNRGSGAKRAVTEKTAPNAAWVIVDPLAIIRGDQS